ncbi:MAG: Xaa-Pro peptidase family protein [Bryobacteraceae bacterium]
MKNSEFSARRGAFAAQLRENQMEAYAIAFLPNVRYLTGFTGSSGMLLQMASGDAVFFTDPRYQIQSAAEVDCQIRVSRKALIQDLAAAVKRRKIRRLGFEKSRLGFEGYEFLNEHMPLQGTLTPLGGLIETLRMVKSASEIELIRRSVLTNSRAFSQGVARIRPGRTTEADLAAEIDYRMRKLGAERPAFDTIVAAGPRAALPHARPSRSILGGNELILIDMGASQAGYASDMTRMLHVGRPTPKALRIYKAVLQAQLAAIDAVRPGVAAAKVDQVAREVLKAEKLDRAFIHSTGHGLGLEIHEMPRLGKKDRTVLQEGMAITIEPGAYLEGVLGIRIEDTVAVTRTGCEILTPTSKDLLEL